MPTVLCGSLSLHPVSLGAAMHRAAYRVLGLDFAYVPFKVSELGGALTGMRALGIRGFGVSMPYKLDVMPLLDALEPLAERIGAVNTIVNDDGRLTGYNTDAAGARRALEEVCPLSGTRITVLGAGGAARAVAFAFADAGARVHLANRTQERARELAEAIGRATGAELTSSALSAEPPPAEVLVNASSAGMEGVSLASPLLGPHSEAWLAAPRVVMDIVYKPIGTALLAEAERRGKATIHGGRMLLHQAAEQFELYTGHPAPLAAMDEALRETLRPPSGAGAEPTRR
jgi:shikimate dehydrogenase